MIKDPICSPGTWEMRSTSANIICRYALHTCSDCIEVTTLARVAAMRCKAVVLSVMHNQKQGLMFEVTVRGDGNKFKEKLSELLEEFYGSPEGVANELGGIILVNEDNRIDPDEYC